MGHNAGSQGDMKIARVSYRGWEGVLGLKCDIEIFARNEKTKFVSNIQDDGPTRRLQLKRKDVERDYEMRIASMDEGTTQISNWKGSKSALGLVYDNAPSCNGNLKLVDPDRADRVPVVWKNRTDLLILGTLHVMYNWMKGERIFGRGCSELSRTSICRTLVCQGWLGGLSKSEWWRIRKEKYGVMAF
jgi:hypothetical protein